MGSRSTASRTCRASPPTPSTSSSRPATRVRSRRSASTCRTIRRSASSYGSKSVSLSNVNEAYDKSTLPGIPQRVLVDAGGSRARDEVERARRRADDQHARGDRPRLGQGRRAAEGQPADGAQGAVLGARGRRAPISSRCTSCPIRSSSSSASSRRPITTTIVRAEYEGYTRNALVQLRRVREGTQIEEDHMRNRQMIVRWLMANTKAIERADARRQDLLRDDRRQGVPRRRRPAARRGAAHQGRRRLRRRRSSCSRPTACTSIPKLRDEVVARVDRLHLPSYTGFVMPKLDAGHRRGGRDHRRDDFVSAGSHAQMLEYSAATRELRR